MLSGSARWVKIEPQWMKIEDIIVKFQNTGDKEILKASREKRNKSPSKDPELKVTLDFSLLARQFRSSAFRILGEDDFQHRLEIIYILCIYIHTHTNIYRFGTGL